MAQTVFNYKNEDFIIQCRSNEKMEDIFNRFRRKADVEREYLIFLYNGNYIKNDELTFDKIANTQDRERRQINILVIGSEPDPEPIKLINSNNIICPECKQDIKLLIEDYNISLSECKNKHEFDNIYFNKLDETQTIDISTIICKICKKFNMAKSYNNLFYKCITCKIDLCPLCKISHEKSHNIINYDDYNYICEQHNKTYIAYCDDCKQNICTFCEQNHKNHKIITFGQIIPDKDQKAGYLKQLKEKIDKLNDDINGIITRLEKVKENFQYYYDLNKKIINNFNLDKINYEILYNVNNINKNNTLKDIDDIINENNITKKTKKILDIYNKMSTDSTISLLYDCQKKDSKLFGEKFVENNKDICKMRINGKEYQISEKFDFSNFNNELITIKLKGMKNVSDMTEMFSCTSLLLSATDLSKCYTSNIFCMERLFWYCDFSLLPDISNWDTSNVKNMKGMFDTCDKLISLPDISKWDTSNVIDMSDMFNRCNSLKSLPDISKWDTSNVEDMSRLLNGCFKLKSLPDISKWNTSKVKSMSYMFHSNQLLISLPEISKWNISNVTNISGLFNECKRLESLPDISKWDTSNVKNMSEMFRDCILLKSLPEISKWNVSNLEDNDDMFSGCDKLLTKPKIKKKKKGLFW